MKLVVVIISALLVTVLAKPAANKRRVFRGDESRILKKALSVLHDVERREDNGEDGSGSGEEVYSYPAADETECAQNEVFCNEWGTDVCMRLGVCDGYASCANGEDEANCEDFQCFEGTSNICMSGNLSHTCFPNSYTCDGYLDCPEDHFDELACTEKTNCTSMGYDYQCPDENTCYWEWDICDGHENCLGGFDEADCMDDAHEGSGSGSDKRALSKKEQSGSGSGKRNYGSGSAKRNYGSGSSKRNYGSGSAKRNYGSGSAKRNYGSGSAVMNFGSGNGKRNVTSKRGEGCASNEFQCVSGGCIDAEYVCDLYDGDCDDNSDEEGCDESKCNTLEGRHWCTMIESEFNGVTKCIDLGHRCDGHTVCKDGSDEEGCEDYTCPTGYEKCQQTEEKKNYCYRSRHCRSLGLKRDFGSGSGSGRRGADVTMEASEKRMLTQELKHLLDALKED